MKAVTADYEIAKKLMAYTGKIAWPTILLFCVCFLIYTMVLWASITSVMPLWAGTIINLLVAYLLFTPLHEACHRNISGKNTQLRPIESAIGWLSGLVLLAPFPLIRFLHDDHHRHTNDPEKDPDYWVASQSTWSLIVKCGSIYLKYIVDYSKNANTLWAQKENRLIMVANAVFMIFLYAGIILWMVFGNWQQAFFLVILPAQLALAFLAFAFDWLPHHPHAVRQRYLDTRIIISPVLTILLVSQNMHLIHHLYSGIPFYHYGKAYQVMKDRLIKEGSRIDGG